MKNLLLISAFSLLYLVGCAGQPQNSSSPSVGSSVANLGGDNGMDPNGLDGNGMDGNGLDPNGLDANGLDANGMDPNGLDPNGLDANGITGAQAAAQFNGWFGRHLDKVGANSDKIMKYIAKCALPAGQSLTFTVPNLAYSSPFTPATCSTDGVNTTCSYPGVLGLAPVWASNQPIPLNEQRLISACLAAHINASAETITVSFHGANLLVGAAESLQYAAQEATFWGNIFDRTGVYMFKSTSTFGTGGFVPRGCSTASACAPMVVQPTGWSIGTGIGTRYADGSYLTTGTAQPNNNTNPALVYPAITTYVDPSYAAAHTTSAILLVTVSGLPIIDSGTGYWVNGPVTGAAHAGYPSDYRPFFQIIQTPGTYSFSASQVTNGGHTYVPTAPSTVTLQSGAVTEVDVTYQ